MRTVPRRAAPVVAFSPGNRSSLDLRHRTLTLSSERWLLLRAVAACLERTGDISHAFGGLNSWHLLRSLGRRPIILTVVSAGPPVSDRLYEKVHTFVAESPELVQALRRVGVPRERIRLIYPGIDLSAFASAPAPASGRFRVLFASWPERLDQLEGRGVFLLVELARRCPDVDVVLLLRTWGDIDDTRGAIAALDPPGNVRLEELGARSMPEVYAGAHVVAGLFAEGFGKSAPQSVLEAMASGRPALVSTQSGIATLVQETGAGVVVARTVDEVVTGVERLRQRWPEASRQARLLAEETFGHHAFLGRYADLYAEIAAQGHPRRPAPADGPPPT